MNRGPRTQARTAGRVAINGYALRAMRVLAGLSTTTFINQVSNETLTLDRTILNRIENGHIATVPPGLFKRFVTVLGLTDPKALMANPHADQAAA